MEPIFFNEYMNSNAEQMKNFLPVNINLRFETVAPFLVDVEDIYIKPILGKTLTNKLSNYLESNEPNELLDNIINCIRAAELRLAIWRGFDTITTMISDNGVASNVEKENRLFRYQEENIRKSLKTDGFNLLDKLLFMLEDNIAELPEFETSTYYTQTQNSLICSTKDFNECYNIDNSRLVYLRMKQYIRDVEQLELQHRIGEQFYNVLLQNKKNEEFERVLKAFKLFVVYKAVANGAGELHKLPTEKGLIFEANKAEDVEMQPVSDKQLFDTRKLFDLKAEQYMDKAINILKENQTKYPAYFEFAGNSPANGVINIENRNKKIFLA